MTYEEKVKALEVFNKLEQGLPPDFMQHYRAWAASTTSPILHKIAEKRPDHVKVVTGIDRLSPVIVPPHSYYLPGMNFDFVPTIEDKDGDLIAGSFTVQAGGDMVLGRILPETIDEMIEKVAEGIAGYEREIFNITQKFIDNRLDGRGDVTLYIKKGWESHDDPTLIKQKKMGIFGWQEVAVVVVV